MFTGLCCVLMTWCTSLWQRYEVIPVLQMRKRGHGEVKASALGHRLGELGGKTSGCLAPKPLIKCGDAARIGHVLRGAQWEMKGPGPR